MTMFGRATNQPGLLNGRARGIKACMSNLSGKVFGVVVALMATMSAAYAVTDSPGGPAVNQLNLADAASPIASQIYDLHTLMLIICSVIFVLVFSFMFYSIWAHRKSKGHKAAHFHESTLVEIIWTVIPFVIVIVMGLLATRTVVAMKDTSGPDLTIKATGYQWKWGYDYLQGEGEGIAFLSNLSTPRAQIENREAKGVNYLIEVDHPMVVPVNRKVRIITTANDVIHAWMVPALGVKQDAIPGMVRDTWFKATRLGEFRGQCAELCGKEHAFMPIVVKVVSDADYAAWVKTQKAQMAALADDPAKTWTQDELIARGEKVYTTNCVACHQATGKGVPGAFPALDGSPTVLGPKADQIALLLHGRKAMPSWKSLSDVEIASVITYTRHAWSNGGKGKDPIIQPVDVRAVRGN